MDVNQYMDMFIDESKEHLQHMNDILLILEKNPEDEKELNELFRIAHTIKGMSGTMGFNNVLNLTHQMENVMDLVRNHKLKVTGNVVDLLFECLDQLEQYVIKIENDQREGENVSDDLVHKLQLLTKNQKTDDVLTVETEKKAIDSSLPKNPISSKSIEVDEYVGSMIKKAIDNEYNIFNLRIILNDKCMLKSARAYIIFSTLEKMAEIIHATPSIEDIEDEKFDDSFELIIITKQNKEAIMIEMNSISEIEDIIYTKLTNDNISYQQDDVDATDMSSNIFNKEAVLEKVKSDEDSPKRSKTGKTVRVDIDRLDNLMNLVSELIIIKTRLEDAHQMTQQKSISDTTEQLERITTSLHDAVMKVRMVPIERVFNRFPRMVRDLSKDLGKDIDLQMSGEDTEVDRTVIDEIGDPLIHLIRNAIDHGIEDRETRIRNHKNQEGTLKLIAYPDGNSVVIEVQDDGKGIDIARVKQKALDKGLLSEAQSQLIEDKEVIQFLFHPGFSTVDKVSDLSGRGVGLDVVKTKIETLGGIVEVESQPEKGTRFIIRLPLTLAIIQALLVHVGDEKYAIPLNNIREITTINEENIRKVQGKEVVLFRQTTLPILRLANLLSVEGTYEKDSDEEYTVVIINHGDKTFGLVVDALIGQQEVVIKSLGRYLSTIKGIAGATILGNGTVALIVDTNSFL